MTSKRHVQCSRKKYPEPQIREKKTCTAYKKKSENYRPIHVNGDITKN